MIHSLRDKQRRSDRSPLPRRERSRATDQHWLFRSYDDLHHDLIGWLPRLPRVAAVCGVPRSGVIVASQLAALLNVPLISFEDLSHGQTSASWRPPCSKPLDRRVGFVLVVDDSSWSGRAMQAAREQIGPRDDVIFGAVYCSQQQSHALDCVGYVLDSINHLFAWNYLRDIHASTTLTDMDGVLCDDWPGDVNDENHEQYQTFLDRASPRVRPIYHLRGVVTGRVARHRAKTIAWLRRHGIECLGLHMPFETDESRRGACVGTRKAEIYAADSGATLFVESDVVQARVIQQRSRKPVLCTDTLELLQ